MPIRYLPCQWISPETSMPCEEFYPETGVDLKFCVAHRAVPCILEDKDLYIDKRNAAMKFASELTLDELDARIGEVEAQIEELKIKFHSYRGVRGDKLDKLSEEEREVRKKWKPLPGTIKSLKKKDVVGDKSSKLGISMDALRNMDMDALMAKFEQAKGAK